MNKDIEERLIKEKESSLSLASYISFSGWNCRDLEDNECEGWDMRDRRCQCGNRRVTWTIDRFGKTEKELTVDDVYAQAY